MDNIFYSIRNGKNPKYSYYLKSYFLRLLPLKAICRKRLNKILAQANTRSDKNYINDRVNYYNRLIEPVKLPEGSPCLNELKLQKKGKVYYFDSFEYLRYFPENLQWNYCFGDINFMPDTPSIVKSRPIHNQSANAILLNLNKVRHFIFVKDKIPFEKKMDKVIFRGKVNEGKTKRIAFFNKYFGNPLCDLGDTSRNGNPAWRTGKKTIAEHLRYKFILALEGNDVASNLKWVMRPWRRGARPLPRWLHAPESLRAGQPRDCAFPHDRHRPHLPRRTPDHGAGAEFVVPAHGAQSPAVHRPVALCGVGFRALPGDAFPPARPRFVADRL